MSSNTPIFITKSSGDTEPFMSSKLEESLLGSGASTELTQEIVMHITADLREGMPTSEIYRHAFTLLRKSHRPIAARYSLKRALMEYGPSGFPFERYFARILDSYGYQTEVGVQVAGACVSHEVDVVAKKGNEIIFVEAKFHNSPETKSDVKTALYIHARFLDIAKNFSNTDGIQPSAWLVTNTIFTTQAIAYANCVGLRILGWNYPKGASLQDLITATQMHPVTCLTSLTTKQKRALVDEGKILCRDLRDNDEILARIGVSKQGLKHVQDEVSGVCPITNELTYSALPGDTLHPMAVDI